MTSNGKGNSQDVTLAASATGLVENATALDREMDRHERLVQSLKNCELDSQKSIAKAAELAQQANDSQQQISGLVRELLDSIHRVRERNMAAVETANSCIEELENRSERLKELLDKFAEIGRTAHEVNQAALEMRQANGTPEEQRTENLIALAARMLAIRDDARQLSTDAKTAGFMDLVKQADGLAQQLASLQNKLQLLADKLR
jgi:methyl-accepting chemotaxis protein